MTATLTHPPFKKLQRFCVFFIFALVFFAESLAAQDLSKLTHEQIKQKRTAFVDTALAYRGTPYRYGGDTKRGMDCSGLIFVAGRDGAGISLPRTAKSLSQRAERIKDSELEPGDLVFFVTSGMSISHVGIYIGNGEFVHSASSGPKTGVIVSKLSERYWMRTYSFAGRIFPSAAQAQAVASSSGASSSSSNASSNGGQSAHQSSNTASSSRSSSTSNTASTQSASSTASSASSSGTRPSANTASAQSSRPAQARYSPYGFRFELRGTALWDFNIDEYLIRGATASVTGQWRGRSNFYPGLTAGFTWDTRHDTMSVPLYLSVTARNGLGFFVGTQFIFSSGGEGSKEIFFPGLVGVSWNSPYKDLGPVKIGFYQSIECVFVRKEGVAGETLSDVFRLATGVSFACGK